MAEKADLVVRNAKIFTAAAGDGGSAVGFAVAGGRILAVAHESSAELDAFVGTGTRVEDVGGAAVVPGLFDAHCHHIIGGASLFPRLSFPADAPLGDILATVEAWTRQLPGGAWAVGGTWGSTLLPEISTVGARRELDQVSHGHPVMLFDDTHHNNWVNTEGLRLAGIPLKGDHERTEGTVVDQATGETVGVLLERAVIPVRKALEKVSSQTDDDWVRFGEAAWRLYTSMGVTGLQEAVAEGKELRALRWLEKEGKLNGRVSCCLLFVGSLTPGAESASDLDRLAREVASDLIHTDWVKIHLDGVPPPRTAAFLEPYLPSEDCGPGHRGHVYIPHAELVELMRGYASDGRSVKLHCTGDASVRAALDAIEVLRGEGLCDVKFQIAHGQFVSEPDRPRMRDLDVIAEISPFIWYPGVISEAIAKILPAHRAAQIHPNRDLTDLGVLVAAGSDWPVSPEPNIWEGIAGLVTRADPTGAFPGTLWPEQALTVAEALRVFTINGAAATGMSDVAGSIEPGKSADFVVIDRDPLTVAPAEIAHTRVLQTWFAGRRVYNAVAGHEAPNAKTANSDVLP
ncbi:MAG: amidohydrolase [Trebonia sp.]